jgi:hypothetical protein
MLETYAKDKNGVRVSNQPEAILDSKKVKTFRAHYLIFWLCEEIIPQEKAKNNQKPHATEEEAFAVAQLLYECRQPA